VYSQDSARSGTPDCPVVHLTVSGAPGWTPVNRPLSGEVWQRTAIIHRTVRWCTGLSGEPTVGWANGRPRNPRVTRGRANGQMGALDYPVCTRQCSVHQRLEASTVDCVNFGRKSGTGQCPVVHRTVRCATRQKARIAFLVCSQWLLGPLCL
jgi:hypothetical protein